MTLARSSDGGSGAPLVAPRREASAANGLSVQPSKQPDTAVSVLGKQGLYTIPQKIVFKTFRDKEPTDGITLKLMLRNESNRSHKVCLRPPQESCFKVELEHNSGLPWATVLPRNGIMFTVTFKCSDRSDYYRRAVTQDLLVFHNFQNTWMLPIPLQALRNDTWSPLILDTLLYSLYNYTPPEETEDNELATLSTAQALKRDSTHPRLPQLTEHESSSPQLVPGGANPGTSISTIPRRMRTYTWDPNFFSHKEAARLRQAEKRELLESSVRATTTAPKRATPVKKKQVYKKERTPTPSTRVATPNLRTESTIEKLNQGSGPPQWMRDLAAKQAETYTFKPKTTPFNPKLFSHVNREKREAKSLKSPTFKEAKAAGVRSTAERMQTDPLGGRARVQGAVSSLHKKPAVKKVHPTPSRGMKREHSRPSGVIQIKIEDQQDTISKSTGHYLGSGDFSESHLDIPIDTAVLNLKTPIKFRADGRKSAPPPSDLGGLSLSDSDDEISKGEKQKDAPRKLTINQMQQMYYRTAFLHHKKPDYSMLGAPTAEVTMVAEKNGRHAQGPRQEHGVMFYHRGGYFDMRGVFHAVSDEETQTTKRSEKISETTLVREASIASQSRWTQRPMTPAKTLADDERYEDPTPESLEAASNMLKVLCDSMAPPDEPDVTSGDVLPSSLKKKKTRQRREKHQVGQVSFEPYQHPGLHLH